MGECDSLLLLCTSLSLISCIYIYIYIYICIDAYLNFGRFPDYCSMVVITTINLLLNLFLILLCIHCFLSFIASIYIFVLSFFRWYIYTLSVLACVLFSLWDLEWLYHSFILYCIYAHI